MTMIDVAGRAKYFYDSDGRLDAVVDALGQAWYFSYHADGRLAAETDFDGRTSSYAYDATGRLITGSDAAGDTVDYVYDPLGRLTQRRTADTVTQLQYDAEGRLSTVTSPQAVVRFEYDVRGRVIAETINGRTVHTSYDGDTVAARTTPSGRTGRWGFDAAGKPVTLSAAGHVIQFGYDDVGREVHRSVDGVTALRQVFDDAGRLVTQHIAEARRGYSWTAAGRITAITDSVTGDRAFVADDSGHVTGVHSGGELRERYEYDDAGRLVGQGGDRWQFDGTMLVRAGDAEFEYDRKGRLIVRRDAQGTWRFEWDAENNLVRLVTPAGERWRYRYDGFGRRVAKQRLASDGTVTEEVLFAWSGDLLLEETGPDGSITWDYRPDGTAPVAETSVLGLRAMVTDVIGTPTHLVDATGRLSGWARGDLWGRTSDAVDTPLRFPGQYRDAESGLHYNRFRYYDPATARYLSPDPLGLASGPDPAAYVGDPLTLVDPLGLASCKPSQPSLNPFDAAGQPSAGSPNLPSQLPAGPVPPSPARPAAGWSSHADAWQNQAGGTTSAELARISSRPNLTFDEIRQALQPTPDRQSAPADVVELGARLKPTPDMIVPIGTGKPERLIPYEPYELRPFRLEDGEFVNLVVRRLPSGRYQAYDKGEPVGPELSLVDVRDAVGDMPRQMLTSTERNVTGGMPSSRSSRRGHRNSHRSHRSQRQPENSPVEYRSEQEGSEGSFDREASPEEVAQQTSRFYRVVTSVPQPTVGFGRSRFGPRLENIVVDRTGPHVPQEVQFRIDEEPLYRFDGRTIDQIRAEGGFRPRSSRMPRSLQSYQNTTQATSLVSFTRDREVTFDVYEEVLERTRSVDRHRHPDNNVIYRYQVMAPGGIDVFASLGSQAYLDQHEVVFYGGMRDEYIVEATPIWVENDQIVEGDPEYYHPSAETQDDFDQHPDDNDDSYGDSSSSYPAPVAYTYQPYSYTALIDAPEGAITADGKAPGLLDLFGDENRATTNPDSSRYVESLDEYQRSGRVLDVPSASPPRTLGDFKKSYPSRPVYLFEGSRGPVSDFNAIPANGTGIVGYRTGLGRPGDPFHVVGVNKTEAGDVRFVDPQTAEVMDAPPVAAEGMVVVIDTTGTDAVPTATEPAGDGERGISTFLEGADRDTGTPVEPAAAVNATLSDATSVASFDDVAPATVAKSTDETPTVGDPIDVTTGRMILTEVDAVLPGLTLERTYRSDYRWGRSFGRSWASTLDQAIVVDGDRVRYLAADGSVLTYPLPAVGVTALPEVGRTMPLRRLAGGGWLLTDPLSGSLLLFAESSPAVASLTDVVRDGVRWMIDRDNRGTPTALSSSTGATIELSTSAGLVTKLWLPGTDGKLVAAAQFGFDEDRRLTDVVNSSGAAERFEYADGRLVRWEDRNGEWYTYTYDKAGRCVSTDGKGGYLRYRLEYFDGRTVVTDSLGAVRTYRLNDRLQVEAETDALGATTRTEWDEANRLRSQTDPLDRVTTYEYDAEGRPTVITRPDGSRSTTAYDETGRAVSWTDFDGVTHTREFDAGGLLRAEVDETGVMVRSQRPALNQPATVLRAGSTTEVRNAARQIMSTATGDDEARFEYDVLGRVVAIEDEQGKTRLGWTFEGELAWRVHPGGEIEEFFYDGEGNLVEHVEADGLRTWREYGAFDQVTAVIDEDGNRTGYEYDTELRLIGVTNPEGETWRYTYDPNGRLIEETDFAGRTQRYAYDAAGQLIEHTDAVGERTVFTYDLLGRVVEQRTGDTVTRLTYDQSGRIVEATDPDSAIRIERDALGRVVSETVNGRTVTARYRDRLGLVTARTRPSGAVTEWSYDDAGHPVVLVAGGQRIEADRFSEASPMAWPGDTSVRYTLDAAGRPATRSDATGRWQFAWDHRDRLVGVSTPGGDRWEYRYDAFNRRIAKQRRGAAGAVLEKIDFVWFGDLLVEQHRHEHDGPVITSSWEYHPESTTPVAHLVDGSWQALNPYAPDVWVDGRYRDPETGLHYDRTGFYDPATARYLQRPTVAGQALGKE